MGIEPWVFETDLTNVTWISPGAYLGGNGHYLYGSDDTLLTIADIGHLTIMPPTPSELSGGLPGVGSGAPRELGTNIAYGFNLVFGDTQSNYIGGYQINADPTLLLADDQGPITSNVVAGPVPIDIDAILTATVDDSTTGGSDIASAEYSLDEGGWQSMSAEDGGFDEVVENETANHRPLAVGVYEL